MSIYTIEAIRAMNSEHGVICQLWIETVGWATRVSLSPPFVTLVYTGLLAHKMSVLREQLMSFRL